MGTILESADKQSILDAQKADEAAAKLPRLEGAWCPCGGRHLVGPDPTQPEKLWTLHASDPLVTVDGKTFGYEPTIEPKTAPSKCAIVERDPVKWAGATPVSVSVDVVDSAEQVVPS